MPEVNNQSPQASSVHLDVSERRTGPAGGRRRWPFGLLFIGLIMAGWAAYLLAGRSPQNKTSPTAPSVPTVLVRTGTLEQTLRVAGQTGARNFATIVFAAQRGQMAGFGRVSTTLTKLVAGGTHVKAGDVVAELDSEGIVQQVDDLEASIEQADLDLAQLKAQQALDWQRLEQTVRSAKASLDQATQDYRAADVKTPIERELLKLALDQAQATYEQQLEALPFKKTSQTATLRTSELSLKHLQSHYARLLNDLKNYTFRAPMEGLVVLQTVMRSGGVMAQYQAGDSLTPGNMFMKIVDTSSMQLLAYASQAEASEIRIGQSATVTLDAFPGLEFPAKIYSLGAMAQQGWRENYYVRTIPVVLRIAGNDPRLLPDLSAAANVRLARKDNVCVLPLAAVHSEGEKQFVFLRTPAGFEKRYVETGLRNTTLEEIASGLAVGDEVALATPPASSQ